MADTTNMLLRPWREHIHIPASLAQIFGHHVFVKLLANILAL
jgi:hypothetical protein